MKFGRTIEGELIPLDLRSPVFHVDKDMFGTTIATRSEFHYVSHFSTCPKASEFSKGRKP